MMPVWEAVALFTWIVAAVILTASFVAASLDDFEGLCTKHEARQELLRLMKPIGCCWIWPLYGLYKVFVAPFRWYRSLS